MKLSDAVKSTYATRAAPKPPVKSFMARSIVPQLAAESKKEPYGYEKHPDIYEDGKKGAIVRKLESDNPHKEKSSEWWAWKTGHQDASERLHRESAADGDVDKGTDIAVPQSPPGTPNCNSCHNSRYVIISNGSRQPCPDCNSNGLRDKPTGIEHKTTGTDPYEESADPRTEYDKYHNDVWEKMSAEEKRAHGQKIDEYFKNSPNASLEDALKHMRSSGESISDSARAKAQKEGDTESDGSFPIRDRGDLENAVKAFGRSKNKSKTKSWIEKRARELHAETDLPENWGESAELMLKADENFPIGQDVEVNGTFGKRLGVVSGHTPEGMVTVNHTHRRAGQTPDAKGTHWEEMGGMNEMDHDPSDLRRAGAGREVAMQESAEHDDDVAKHERLYQHHSTEAYRHPKDSVAWHRHRSVADAHWGAYKAAKRVQEMHGLLDRDVKSEAVTDSSLDYDKNNDLANPRTEDGSRFEDAPQAKRDAMAQAVGAAHKHAESEYMRNKYSAEMTPDKAAGIAKYLFGKKHIAINQLVNAHGISSGHADLIKAQWKGPVGDRAGQ